MRYVAARNLTKTDSICNGGLSCRGNCSKALSLAFHYVRELCPGVWRRLILDVPLCDNDIVLPALFAPSEGTHIFTFHLSARSFFLSIHLVMVGTNKKEIHTFN